MPRRTDSPYYDDTDCPYPPGLEDVLGDGDVCFLAQNEGQKVLSPGLHFRPKEDVDE